MVGTFLWSALKIFFCLKPLYLYRADDTKKLCPETIAGL